LVRFTNNGFKEGGKNQQKKKKRTLTHDSDNTKFVHLPSC